MHRAALTILATIPVVAAQGRTLIVDQANGPGTDFLDVPAAVAFASDGDVLRLRAGAYSGVTTSKALTIVGPATASIGTSTTPSLIVENLPSGRTFVIQGIELRPGGAIIDPTTVRNCRGRVVFDRARLLGTGAGLPREGLLVRSSDQVQLNRCSALGGRSGVYGISSTILITDSTVTAADSSFLVMSPPTMGCGAISSNLLLSGCTVTGGSSLGPFGGTGAAALWARDSNVTISGDAVRAFTAGTSPGSIPVSAIELTGGALTIDPAVRLVPAFGAAPIVGGTVTTRRLAALRVAGAPVGGSVDTELYSPHGDLVVFSVGLPGDAVAAPFLGGSVYLDLTGPVVTLPLGVQGATEHFAFSFPLPNNLDLAARAFTYQYLSGTLAGGFQLSNPAATTVE